MPPPRLSEFDVSGGKPPFPTCKLVEFEWFTAGAISCT